MDIRFLHITGTIIALGIIASIATAIIYFMRFPMFDAVAMAWLFVICVLGVAVAAGALAVRAIWSDQG